MTKIGGDAFVRCASLKSITIPAGITAISEKTFTDCKNLTDVHIPDGVTSIGPRAFNACENLRGLILPESVTEIGTEAFRNCGALENIVLPAGVSRIPANTFLNCGTLTDVYYSGTEDEWNAVEVEDGNESLQKAAIHCRAEIYTPGDADGDGRLTVADARITHRISLVPESRQPDTSGFKACDADNDGRITAEDAALIFKAAFGLIAPPVWHF